MESVLPCLPCCGWLYPSSHLLAAWLSALCMPHAPTHAHTERVPWCPLVDQWEIATDERPFLPWKEKHSRSADPEKTIHPSSKDKIPTGLSRKSRVTLQHVGRVSDPYGSSSGCKGSHTTLPLRTFSCRCQGSASFKTAALSLGTCRGGERFTLSKDTGVPSKQGRASRPPPPRGLQSWASLA